MVSIVLINYHSLVVIIFIYTQINLKNKKIPRNKMRLELTKMCHKIFIEIQNMKNYLILVIVQSIVLRNTEIG